MKFSTAEWIGLLVSILTMGVGITTFSYSTFVLKDVYHDDKGEMSKRLERIEFKLDRALLERK